MLAKLQWNMTTSIVWPTRRPDCTSVSIAPSEEGLQSVENSCICISAPGSRFPASQQARLGLISLYCCQHILYIIASCDITSCTRI